jgi:hypothetical protein
MSNNTHTVLVPFIHGLWSYREGEVLAADDLAMRVLDDAELDRRAALGFMSSTARVETEKKIARIAQANKAVSPPKAGPNPPAEQTNT